MLLEVNGKYGNYLSLGVQTNPGNTTNQAHWLAKKWAPEKAKSYTIKNFRHTNYYGVVAQEETGYAEFDVWYYSTKKEGEFVIEDKETK